MNAFECRTSRTVTLGSAVPGILQNPNEWRRWGAAALVSLIIAAALGISAARAGATTTDALAEVNGEAITAKELETRLGAKVSQLEEQITLEITQRLNNLKAFLKRIEATRIARELAEENVRNQKARYDVGLATTKDLIDFTDRLTQAERAEVEALTGYNIELANLRHADGTLLRERSVLLERTSPEAPPWFARF